MTDIEIDKVVDYIRSLLRAANHTGSVEIKHGYRSRTGSDGMTTENYFDGSFVITIKGEADVAEINTPTPKEAHEDAG